ncbi:amino acid transporter [Agrobacterium tumefaciens]|uniref:nucleotidyltransferase domain-containing protein n=1 Tax=Rhizobium sp. TaxID=391 RepID=UPI0010BE9E0F|nr:amino acid transporter [Agrobacterium tumefaciens]
MNNQTPVPDQDAWEAWSPAELFRRLGSLSRPWCVVGGWALDLWHGKKTREHEDLEFTILRADLGIFRRELNDMEFYTVNDGVLELLAADREPATEIFQIWCFDRAALRWRVDMMIEPGTDESWVYKREPQISRPRTEMVARTADGIPYLTPAAVLLFKAKYRRPKDEEDFAHAAPKLPAAERRWLRDCLGRFHPEHEWAKAL